MKSIKEKVKYIKIKDLNGRYSLSKTKSGILNVKDEWKKSEVTCQTDDPGSSEKYDWKALDWKALEDSIKTHGIKNPLVVAVKSGYVEDGNHRLAVLKLLYSPNKKVPCILVSTNCMEQIKEELEFHQNEINTLEDGIAFQQYANVGKIIKIY